MLKSQPLIKFSPYFSDNQMPWNKCRCPQCKTNLVDRPEDPGFSATTVTVQFCQECSKKLCGAMSATVRKSAYGELL